MSRLSRWTRSLRARITAVAFLVVLVLLGIVGVLLVGLVERSLLSQVDDDLTGDADFINRAIVTVANLPPGAGHSAVLVQLVDENGNVLGASDAAEDTPPLAVPPGGTETVFLSEMVDGQPVRLIVTPFRADIAEGVTPEVRDAVPTAEGWWLVVGRPIDQVEQAVASTRTLSLVGVPLLAAVLGLVIGLVANRALRPVEQIRDAVERVKGDDVGRQVPLSGRGDEIDRLADTMNDMLGRVDAATLRQRRFVADASHELRSPLAGLRVLLETEPDDPAEAQLSRIEALRSLERIQSLVDDLLLLARRDAAERPTQVAAVDLDEIVLRHAEHLRRTTDLALDVTGVSGGQVAGREAELDRLVGNLATNAARHAAGQVSFAVREVGATVELTVADDGDGVAEADRQRIFERFTRLDDARTRDSGGAGLGLAIVADVATSHGGRVWVEAGSGGGAAFVVVLPASVALDAVATVEA